QHDGRVSLYLAEHASLLLRPNDPTTQRPNDPLQQRIREHLAQRGASFFPQILQASGGFGPEVWEALWDLVWAGEVTNDTLQPLRAYMSPRRQTGRHQVRERAESATRRRPTLLDRRARRISPTALSTVPR